MKFLSKLKIFVLTPQNICKTAANTSPMWTFSRNSNAELLFHLEAQIFACASVVQEHQKTNCKLEHSRAVLERFWEVYYISFNFVRKQLADIWLLEAIFLCSIMSIIILNT